MTTPKLRDILLSFLKGNTSTFYPVMETRIIQLNPLQITDDLTRFLDISSLQDSVLSKIQDIPGSTYKLVLKNWRFVFRKVPNSHEFYFDILAEDFQVVADHQAIELEELPGKMVDDDEIR